MPKFFFHLVTPGRYQADEIGGEFPSVEAAYLDAWQAALEMGFEMLKERRDPCKHQFEITDEQGRFLLEIPFSDVMRPAKDQPPRMAIQGELGRHIQICRALKADIKAEFSKTRAAIEQTQATLARARAHSSVFSLVMK